MLRTASFLFLVLCVHRVSGFLSLFSSLDLHASLALLHCPLCGPSWCMRCFTFQVLSSSLPSTADFTSSFSQGRWTLGISSQNAQVHKFWECLFVFHNTGQEILAVVHFFLSPSLYFLASLKGKRNCV